MKIYLYGAIIDQGLNQPAQRRITGMYGAFLADNKEEAIGRAYQKAEEEKEGESASVSWLEVTELSDELLQADERWPGEGEE